MDTPTLPARYDWFSVSAHYNPSTLLDGYLAEVGGEPRTIKPKNGYTHAVGLFKTEHPEVIVEYSAKGSPHVLATGYSSQRVFEVTAERFPHYSLARGDVACDFDHADWFGVIDPLMLALTLERGITNDIRGDWDTPGSPSGRTRYAGRIGKSTVVRRLYEFSKHHGYGPAVRFEIEVKPQSKHKHRYAGMSPVDLMRSDGYAVELLRRLGISLDRLRVGRGEPPPLHSQWFLHLARQYGPKLHEFVAMHLDGDITALGPEIFKVCADLAEREATARRPPSIRALSAPAKVAHS